MMGRGGVLLICARVTRLTRWLAVCSLFGSVVVVGGVLVVSDDVQASESVVELVWLSLSGNRQLVCLV